MLITLLCCGDREWSDRLTINLTIRKFGIDRIKYLVHGNARGADRLSAQAYLNLGGDINNIKSFPADWNRLGLKAGPIRNSEMLRFLVSNPPNHVFAFHNNIEFSKGTKDMVNKVKSKNINYEIIKSS